MWLFTWMTNIIDKLTVLVGGGDNFVLICLILIVIEVVGTLIYCIVSIIKRHRAGVDNNEPIFEDGMMSVEIATKITDMYREICVKDWAKLHSSNPSDFFWGETLRCGMLEILINFLDDDAGEEIMTYLQKKYKEYSL